MKLLQDVQLWYKSQCDGEWEHQCGFKIDTLDNPGWAVTVDLNGTHLERVNFETKEFNNSDEDWYVCRVENSQFQAFGDPTKLELLLQTFINWAKADDEWLKPPVYETSDDENQQFWKFLSQVPNLEGKRCSLQDCELDRIKNSVFCREHHFERYKQK
jgi:hypothetical protein